MSHQKISQVILYASQCYENDVSKHTINLDQNLRLSQGHQVCSFKLVPNRFTNIKSISGGEWSISTFDRGKEEFQ